VCIILRHQKQIQLFYLLWLMMTRLKSKEVM
jgi:hypothetical protein